MRKLLMLFLKFNKIDVTDDLDSRPGRWCSLTLGGFAPKSKPISLSRRIAFRDWSYSAQRHRHIRRDLPFRMVIPHAYAWSRADKIAKISGAFRRSRSDFSRLIDRVGGRRNPG